MSRHKLVKMMNLDAELDDFDGNGYNDNETEGGGEELSTEDKARLEEGTTKVRSVLGPEVPVTDREIQDSLWHYYYDVEKTVTYILNQKSGRSSKKNSGGTKKPKDTTKNQEPLIQADQCSTPFSARDFFKDCLWLNIPLDRQGEILVEPIYPRGGLLGGSSVQGIPKISKLAALAAARKKKENDKANGSDAKPTSSSVALLDKLSIKGKAGDDLPKSAPEPQDGGTKPKAPPEEPHSATQTRKYLALRNKTSTPPILNTPEAVTPAEFAEPEPLKPLPITASPSSFAQAILGSLASQDVASRSSPLFSSYFVPVNTIEGGHAELDPFAGPSPDDVVANAQKSSKGMKGSRATTTKSEILVNGAIDGINKVVINDTPRATSKNLDVVSEYENSKKKNAANFVVIGHVDAGKSTLMGRLLYDLKVVDQRTIDRYRKEAESIGKSSFALAWVFDQGTEERNRGVTIDIAMNKFETDKTIFTILDAPGHRDFIPNMIAGASQADFAVLVIDASTGSFESGLKGQTKEHALLVRSMGVQRLIVAINKLDTVSWSSDRFNEIQQQVSAFLTVAGFQPQSITFIPCSGLTGDNITHQATDPDAKWYNGPILLAALESSEPITRALHKPLRITISDVFRGGVTNPLSISGRIDTGSIQVGERVLVVPASEAAYIKAIEVDSEPADWAVAGQNVTLHLTDIDAVHLKSGDVICPPNAPVKCIRSFTTKILAFEFVTPMAVDVLRGRLHVSGRVKELVAVLDKGSGAVVKKKPKIIKPGQVARIFVEIDVEGGVPLEAPGRVILRSGGETVAAGLLE